MYTFFSLMLNVYVCIQNVKWQSNRKIKLKVCLNCEFVILRGKKVLTFKDWHGTCFRTNEYIECIAKTILSGWHCDYANISTSIRGNWDNGHGVSILCEAKWLLE